MNWRRKLWAIEYVTANKEKVLISNLWDRYGSVAHYVGEPTRAMAFTTRKTARKWISLRVTGEFRAVRVIETVRRAK